MLDKQISSFVFLIISIASVKAFEVDIKFTGSSVSGALVNFTATLYQDGKIAKNGNYAYNWNDNADPPHSTVFKTEQPYSNWTVEYPKGTKPSLYEVNLNVERYMIFWFSIAQKSVHFKVTELLNGNMSLTQNGTYRNEQYVSYKDPVNHTVTLKESDMEFLDRNATYIQTFWFENCTYLGVTDGYTYINRYPHIGTTFDIEALVVASFDKLPTPTPSTTTTTTTTTTTSTTTSTTTTTTPKTTTTTSTTTPPTPTISSNSTATSITVRPRARRDTASLIANFNNLTASANARILGIDLASLNEQHSANDDSMTPTTTNPLDSPLPYICFNKSMVAADPKKTYGYFNRRVVSLQPVGEFSSSGKNWLQHGDVLNLDISCKGSSPLEYCYRVFNAPYNLTGNETCSSWLSITSCSFQLRRWFAQSKTILFFIRNPIASSVNQVTINFYETKKQSQLSVIVVPVSFSLIAVILIVFGVSYYIQSRNRFNVEVADFNFGETQSVDMEYKTFQQRLIESLCDAIPHRRRSDSSEFLPDSSPTGSEGGSPMRYNTMT
ncbi:uncharacterized protein LOC129913961 [Episyrphus balteatus]|uniref:uncharacterized protein LOC129913961 n=1 Tax=Episyrphus balteatus TaxID=286459 RepID=UPI002486A15B|nr:uncharacterized protein LOC129913961 [Episyrphus balteatus]